MASSSVYSSLANSSYSFFRILAEASASESNTSVANNTSTISYSVKATFKPTNGYSFSGTTRPNAGYVDILIGGNVVKTITVPFNDGVSDGTVIASASGTTTVTHNADGTGSTTVQVRVRSGSDQNNYSFVWSNATGSSSTLSLSTIPRASSISSVTSSVAINGSNAVTVNINRKSSSFTHTVTVYASVSSSENVRLQQTGVGTSVSFTLPVDWIRAIGSNSSATAHVMIRTYSGSTQIGDVATATFTITKPSASSITCTQSIECNGSNALTVNINPANSAFRHTANFVFGNVNNWSDNITTSKTFVPPMSWLNQIPNDTSGYGTVYIETYYGDIYIGIQSARFTLTVPTSVVPTISSCSRENVNPTSISAWDIFIQNISTSKITVNASGAYGSTIKEYSLFGVWQTSNVIYTSTSSNTGDQEYRVQVKDSRGRVSEVSRIPVYIVPYSHPTLSCNMIKRCLEDGTINDEGTYINANFSFSCASCEGKNTITAKIYTREVTADSFDYKGDLSDGESSMYSGYDIAKAYTVKVVATDAIGNNAEYTCVIETAQAIIDILNGGKGMALGMMASKENALQIGYEITEFLNGIIKNPYGSYAHYTHEYGGDEGYNKFATIKIPTVYYDTPLVFEIMSRDNPSINYVYVVFKNTYSTDPELNYFFTESSLNVYINKSATSTWDLYIRNEWYDHYTITRLVQMSSYAKFDTITWQDEFTYSLPSSAIQAEQRYKLNTVNYKKYCISSVAKETGSNGDCNSITETGLYIVNEGSSWSNGPSTYLNGMMLVYVFTSGYITLQIYIQYDGSTWIRSCWYRKWYAWKALT